MILHGFIEVDMDAGLIGPETTVRRIRGCLSDNEVDTAVSNTEGWTGADIEKCVRQARRSARRMGRREVIYSDVEAAMPPTRKIPLATQRVAAAHELGHAIVGLLVDAETLISVSVRDTIRTIEGPQSLGRTVFEEHLFTRKTSTYFQNRIAMLLAGIAAEELLFSEFDIGASGSQQADLNQATELATMMEIKWGLGGSLAVEIADTPKRMEGLRSKRKGLAQAVDAMLKAQFNRAKSLLHENRGALLRLHVRLMKEKVLTAEDIREAMADARRSEARIAGRH